MGLATFQQGDIEKMHIRGGIAAALGYPPRNMYFVNSNGGAAASTGATGLSPSDALSTLEDALGKCVSNNGDCVVLMGGHAETLNDTATAQLTFSVSGVDVIGLGSGRCRPTLTCASVDIPGILLSGNNNRIKNLRLVGAAATQTSAGSVVLSITGTDNVVEDCSVEHSITLGGILLTAAHRTTLQRLKFLGTAAGPDFCIKVTGSAAPSQDCIIRDIDAQYTASSGLDSAVVVCHQTTGIAGWIMERIKGVGIDVSLLDINGSSAATIVDSLAYECIGVFTTATSAAAAYDVGGTMVVNSFWSDAVAGVSPWLGVGFVNSASPTSVKGTVAGTSVTTAAAVT